MKETWKEIPGYEGHYEVSDHGRVRSLERKVWKKVNGWGLHPVRGKVLRPTKQASGYSYLRLSKDGRVRRFAVHRLVLMAFVGPCPEDHEACHRDGDPTNDSLQNLYWGTHSQNVKDAVRHGTHVDNKGEDHGCSLLREKDVRRILQLLKEGSHTQAKIAKLFGVSRANISAIKNRKSWKHLTGVPTFKKGEGAIYFKVTEDDVREIRSRVEESAQH
jgi:predicted XRE-type DNA-binding protein